VPEVININHIAVIVADLEASLSFWRDALGLSVTEIKYVPGESAEVAFLSLGDSEIELVKPTSGDSGLYRYLEKRGPGMHHICLEVDDIEAVMDQLNKKHVRFINEAPKVEPDGKKFAFIHPESTHGVLVELYELPAEAD